MLKILKASAGSGKTYNLAKEYIRLVIEQNRPDAYRHVLAVTFTNKATEEMKRRILKELYTLSKNPQKSKYLEELEKELKLSPEAIQKRAAVQLSGILHDYSAFAVSTIDRFFQQALRAFAREIGQFSSYQVQLDRDALVTESVDRVLDNLQEGDRAVLDWLTESAMTQLRQNGRFSIENGLMTLAKSLDKLPEEKRRFGDRAQLKELKAECVMIRRQFENKVREQAGRILELIAACSLTVEDFAYKFPKVLADYASSKDKTIKAPTDSFVKKARDPQLWFAKAKAHLRQQAQGMLEGPFEDFVNLFCGDEYRLYLSAEIVSAQIYALGMASELQKAFKEIQHEKNVISIDDTNTILRNIIDGTDTPFIYEKLGVRFEDFLLDEFQDTSDVQWDNFRPLLHNSIDSGNTSLVVGDVKQSIYRWRGSDWNLLGHRLEEEFPAHKLKVLEQNWRTCRKIVEFNNEFFTYAAGKLSALVAPGLYADVEQEPCLQEDAPGSVDVVFTDNQADEIIQTLLDLQARGARWEDIAILVRNNADGALVAAELVGNNIPVVSDDSLYVKASVTVRRLVSQLSLAEAPGSGDKPTAAGYMASSLGVRIPEHYHSLVDLAEALLRDLSEAKPEDFNSEIPYIQSFMDYLQDWVSTNGNNLAAFLKDWADADPKIASPQEGNSVRVMTIHKSKGLEFPFVIFPFAEKVTLYKHSSQWCEADAPLDGTYYVDLTDSNAETVFGKDYLKEKAMQAVDNLNVFYVAMTRPKYGLKVIAAKPPENLGTPKNMSHLLYSFCEDNAYSWGEPFDFGSLKREEHGASVITAGYASFPADSGSRLKFSPEAADYFGDDGSYGPQASRRIRGNVLHNILSKVVVADDLPSAVESAVRSGELLSSGKEEALGFLSGRIASVEDRGWFSPEAKVRLEASVIAPGAGEYRPDRVVIHPGGKVDIVDFKFGKPESKYISQVSRYVKLYRRMGYEKVEGYLWYLDDNLINFVVV